MSGLEIAASMAGIAGFATLAVQIGQGLLKLEKLRKKLRDAPASREHAVACIAATETLLHTVQSYTAPHNSSPITQEILNLCNQSVQKINRIIDAVEVTWKRSDHLGKLKFTLKEKDMRDLRKELEQEQIMLLLALQANSE